MLFIFVLNIDIKFKNFWRFCLCDILLMLRVEIGRCDIVLLRSVYIMFKVIV